MLATGIMVVIVISMVALFAGAIAVMTGREEPVRQMTLAEEKTYDKLEKVL